jgi:hypothetical protein
MRARCFFGLKLEGLLLEQVNKVRPQVLDFFIKEGSPYLTAWQQEGDTYWGKFLEAPFFFKDIEKVQAHIVSIVQRLVEQPVVDPCFSLIALAPDDLSF